MINYIIKMQFFKKKKKKKKKGKKNKIDKEPKTVPSC